MLLKIWEHQDLMKPMVKQIWGKVPALAREFVYQNHCVSFVVNLLNKIILFVKFYLFILYFILLGVQLRRQYKSSVSLT